MKCAQLRALWPIFASWKNRPSDGKRPQHRSTRLDFDRKLLTELVEERPPAGDPSLPAASACRKSPTQARLKRLEAQGYILGYRALLDPEKLDRDHVAFVEVRLTDTRDGSAGRLSTPP